MDNIQNNAFPIDWAKNIETASPEALLSILLIAAIVTRALPSSPPPSSLDPHRVTRLYEDEIPDLIPIEEDGDECLTGTLFQEEDIEEDLGEQCVTHYPFQTQNSDDQWVQIDQPLPLTNEEENQPRPQTLFQRTSKVFHRLWDSLFTQAQSLQSCGELMKLPCGGCTGTRLLKQGKAPKSRPFLDLWTSISHYVSSFFHPRAYPTKKELEAIQEAQKKATTLQEKKAAADLEAQMIANMPTDRPQTTMMQRTIGLFKAAANYLPWSVQLRESLVALVGQRSILNKQPMAGPIAERASHALDSLLGWQLTTPSELGVLGSKPGNIQRYLTPGCGHRFLTTEEEKNIFNKRTLEADELETLQKFALFDFLIGNLDRHGDNWFVEIDEEGTLVGIKAIDNANCFPERRHSPLFATWMLQHRYGWKHYPMAKELLTEEIKQQIQELFGTEEKRMNLFKKMEDDVLNKGIMPNDQQKEKEADIRAQTKNFFNSAMKELLLERMEHIASLCQQGEVTLQMIITTYAKKETDFTQKVLKEEEMPLQAHFQVNPQYRRSLLDNVATFIKKHFFTSAPRSFENNAYSTDSMILEEAILPKDHTPETPLTNSSGWMKRILGSRIEM